MAKQEIKPITSKGLSEVLFERHIISERDYDVCIIVNESEECALIIKDGLLMETVEGGKYYVFDKNELKKEITQVEVIFISKKIKIPLDWGTRQLLAFTDPVYSLPVKIGLNGTVEVQVGNPRKFYSEIVGRDISFEKNSLKTRLSEDIPHHIKDTVSEYMQSNKISYLNIEQAITALSEKSYPKLKDKFFNDYGIRLDKFMINGAIIENTSNKALQFKKLEIEKTEENLREEKRIKDEELKRTEDKILKAKNFKENMIKCKFCGTDLPKEANFCYICGKNVLDIEKPAEPEFEKEDSEDFFEETENKGNRRAELL